MSESLEKINQRAEELVLQIEKYKSASEVNQKTAETLESVVQIIKNVSAQIKPLSKDLGFLRLQYVAITMAGINLIGFVLLYFLLR